MTNYKARLGFSKVVKKVAEVVNNSTTYQDDDELKLELKANTVYSGTLIIIFDSSTTADFKYVFTYPSGMTGFKTIAALTQTTANALTTGSTSLQATGVDAELIAVTHFTIITTNGGTLQLTWAQLALDATDTTVHAGSSLVIFES